MLALHGKPVYCLAVHGERTLVTGSVDKTLRVSDAATGEARLTLKGHAHTVSCLEVAPRDPALAPDAASPPEDAAVVFSGSYDKSVRVWGLDTGRCLRKFKNLHSGWIHCLRLADNVLFTGGADKAVRAVSAATGDVLYELRGHTDSVRCLAHDRDRGLLYSGSNDMTIRVWNLESHTCVKVLTDNANRVFCLQIADNILYSGSSDKVIRAFDMERGKLIRVYNKHTGPVLALQVVNSSLYSGSGDLKAMKWHLRTGVCLKTFLGHADWIRALQVANNTLYTAGDDGIVRLFPIPPDVDTDSTFSSELGSSSAVDFDAMSIRSAQSYASNASARTTQSARSFTVTDASQAIKALQADPGSPYAQSVVENLTHAWEQERQALLHQVQHETAELRALENDRKQLIAQNASLQQQVSEMAYLISPDDIERKARLASANRLRAISQYINSLKLMLGQLEDEVESQMRTLLAPDAGDDEHVTCGGPASPGPL